ncbi:MAG TPA: hypothetical protein VK534_01850 [Methylomirabilota bacterium]|nr:hypothetical protein [Methylomirabilota bacterium]
MLGRPINQGHRPTKHHTPEQRLTDDAKLRSLAAGRLVQLNHETGFVEPSEEFFALSRSNLEISDYPDGYKHYKAVGGWVTKAQAQAEFSDQQISAPGVNLAA